MKTTTPISRHLARTRRQDQDEAKDQAQVEVMDLRNRPLASLPLGEVHRQRLPHRTVLVLLFNQDNQLYLQKRSRSKRIYPGRWDVSARVHVLSGESTLDAAMRGLRDELGMRLERLKLVRQIPPGPEAGPGWTSVYSTGRVPQAPKPAPEEVEDGYYYGGDELTCLVREFRELMTPGLLHLVELGLPFPNWDHA